MFQCKKTKDHQFFAIKHASNINLVLHRYKKTIIKDTVDKDKTKQVMNTIRDKLKQVMNKKMSDILSVT